MKAEAAMGWLRQAGVVLLLASSFATTWAAAPPSEDDTVSQMRALPWQRGPATSTIGDKATVKLPEHAAYLNAGGAGKFLTLTGNLPSPNTSILSGGSWWAALDFNPIGYVKDDEKIDADELLKSIKASDTAENEERRKQGLPELHTDGWYVPPHYDSDSKHLEWGVKLHSSDNPQPIINYSVRLLGRTGVESVVLVSSPEKLDANVRELKTILQSFDFNSGEKYSEWKPGDHVAEIGLAALVVGGAAAVAAKTGLWKLLLGGLAAFWKFIAVGAVAVFAAIGKLFKKKES